MESNPNPPYRIGFVPVSHLNEIIFFIEDTVDDGKQPVRVLDQGMVGAGPVF